MISRISNKINRINGHIETLYPYVGRRVQLDGFKRNTVISKDSYPLEVFLKQQNSKKLVLLSHGMEGHARQKYMLGMAKTMFDNGYDVLTWNLRSCEFNKDQPLGFYHGGAISDLEDVILYANELGYEDISLVGFSLGANISLRYLGEEKKSNPTIKSAVAISCPCDLRASTEAIDNSFYKIYTNFFLKSLRFKLSGHPLSAEVEQIKNLSDFNDKITTKLNGFIDGNDYYQRCSSLYYLKNIKTPVLILNAKNDPFLQGDCFPHKEAQSNPNISLETPMNGGHVGFYNSKTKSYFSEERALEFISNITL